MWGFVGDVRFVLLSDHKWFILRRLSSPSEIKSTDDPAQNHAICHAPNPQKIGLCRLRSLSAPLGAGRTCQAHHTSHRPTRHPREWTLLGKSASKQLTFSTTTGAGGGNVQAGAYSMSASPFSPNTKYLPPSFSFRSNYSDYRDLETLAPIRIIMHPSSRA